MQVEVALVIAQVCMEVFLLGGPDQVAVQDECVVIHCCGTIVVSSCENKLSVDVKWRTNIFWLVSCN